MPDYPSPEEILKKFAELYSLEGSIENSAEFNRRLANIALEASVKSSKLSSDWTSETIAELKDVSSQPKSGDDYSEKIRAFAEKQAEMTAKNMEAYSEVARQVQTATLELMTEYGNKMAEEAEKRARSAMENAVSTAKSK